MRLFFPSLTNVITRHSVFLRCRSLGFKTYVRCSNMPMGTKICHRFCLFLFLLCFFFTGVLIRVFGVLRSDRLRFDRSAALKRAVDVRHVTVRRSRLMLSLTTDSSIKVDVRDPSEHTFRVSKPHHPSLQYTLQLADEIKCVALDKPSDVRLRNQARVTEQDVRKRFIYDLSVSLPYHNR